MDKGLPSPFVIFFKAIGSILYDPSAYFNSISASSVGLKWYILTLDGWSWDITFSIASI